MNHLHRFTFIIFTGLFGCFLATTEIQTFAQEDGNSDPIAIEEILLPQSKISDFPGENIEIATLTVTYDFEDVRIPGSNGMDIVVGREYSHLGSAQTFNYGSQGLKSDWFAAFGRKFDLKIPLIYVEQNIEGQVLSQTGFSCVIDKLLFNINFYMPDASMTTVGFNNAGWMPSGTLMAFSNNSVFMCENGLPVVMRADGTKITYAKQIDSSAINNNGVLVRRLAHYATKMEDRFGNSITLNYGNDEPASTAGQFVAKLDSMVRNDQARVDFDYTTVGSGASARVVIDKIRYGGREINYDYVSANQVGYTIDVVTDEEGRQTDFDYAQTGGWLQSIELPTGAKAEYTYSLADPDFGGFGQVKWKTISGPDIPTRNFVYAYDSTSAFLADHSDIFATESDAADGENLKTIYTVKNQSAGGVPYDANGREQALQTVTNGTVSQVVVMKGGVNSQSLDGEVLLKQMMDWTPMRFGAVGCGKRTKKQFNQMWKVCARPVMTKHETHVYNQGGVDVFVSDPDNFDAYGYPEKTRTTGTESGVARFQRQTYLHDVTNWLIGLPRITFQSATDGNWTQTFQRTYHSHVSVYKSLPLKDYKFSRWVTHYAQYNSSGDLQQRMFNGSDRIERFLNYKRGHAQEIQLPAGNEDDLVSRFEYVDDFGNVTLSKDFRGNEVTYVYDDLDRLTGINYGNTFWNDETTEYFDSGGYSLKSVGHYRLYSYKDRLGRLKLTREEDASDAAATRRYQKFAYTKQGLLEFRSFPMATANPANGTTYVYDALGRRLHESLPETGTYRHWTYLHGNKVESVDGLSNQTVTTYRAFGAPSFNYPIHIQQTVVEETSGGGGNPGDPEPPCNIQDPTCAYNKPAENSSNESTNSMVDEYIETFIDYDIHNNVQSVSQGGVTANYVYDSNKKLCKVSRPDVGDTAMEYLPTGQMKWLAKEAVGSSTVCGGAIANNTTSYIYNKRGLLTFKNQPGALFYVARDLDENITGTITEGGGIMMFYDDRNNMTAQENIIHGLRLEWAYDSNGHRVRTTYPDKEAIEHAPNALGQDTQAGMYAHSADYHRSGGLEKFVFGNGISRGFNRNNAGMVEGIVDELGNSQRFEHYYDFDSEFNLLSLYDAFQPSYDLTGLQYDGIGRLTRVNGIWGVGSFSYDDLGNIQTMALGSRASTYHYDVDNQLASVSGDVSRSFTYDEFGNVTHNGIRGFEYDALGRMRSSGTWTFKYDHNDMRTYKSDGNFTTWFHYSPDGQLMHKQTSDGKTTKYIYLNGALVAEIEKDGASASTTYKHTDALGSVSAESNSAGVITKRYHYEPFGRAIETGQDDDPGFTGHLYDKDLGLNYMKARYYDPEIGRFYSNDPVGFSAFDPATFNRYGYANNNPYKYVDPTGETVAIAAGVGTGLVLLYVLIKKIQDVDIPITSLPIRTESSSDGGNGVKPLPDELVGSPDAHSGQQGDRHNNGELSPGHGGTGDPEEDFATVGGGEERPATPADRRPPGSRIAPNGVTLRPASGKPGEGPRIDIPANGDKPAETLHYPEQTPKEKPREKPND